MGAKSRPLLRTGWAYDRSGGKYETCMQKIYRKRYGRKNSKPHGCTGKVYKTASSGKANLTIKKKIYYNTVKKQKKKIV